MLPVQAAQNINTRQSSIVLPENLIERCSQGNSEALREFFEKYSQDIYNFPMKVFRLDEDEASDFFLYAFERLSDGTRFRSFQKRSSFRTWFYTVLRNLVIDWMRTLREVETVSSHHITEDNQEFDLIANIADPRSKQDREHDTLADFNQRLSTIPLEMRTILKLAYIYYLDLAEDELQYLSARSQLSKKDLLSELLALRHDLSEKEIKNLASEDRITSIYLSILQLKEKKLKLESLSNKESIDEKSKWMKIALIEKAIEKKYEQRKQLLHRKNRGHFVVRTPYRRIATLLGTSEGNISVQVMRILECMREVSL